MDPYKNILRPLLFSGLDADPETAHNALMGSLQWLDRNRHRPVGRVAEAACRSLFCCPDPRLQQTLWGLSFPNPVGLAAGFDKNGVAAGVWPSLGFGFAELGTATSRSQPGNPRPRLFRLTRDRAALNRMGFNNDGAEALANRFRDRRAPLPASHPVGINLGKSKVTPVEEAAADYVASFRLLQPWGDYFVVNVSSPNTPGLRALQDGDRLGEILAALQRENDCNKPLLVKIAPDLAEEAIAEVVAVAKQHRLAGIVATNTTIRRDNLQTQILQKTGKPIAEEAGGISGAPVRSLSTQAIRTIRQHAGGELPIIGVGGIFSAEDAWEKISAGASLVQIYTGWIYEGPGAIARILSGLLQKLEERGFANVAEAVGSSGLEV